ncbi:MAG: WbqC family protein [Tidjanibacter sp.]|nr:WbqC family protein [Tidjanibacter sp.]
MKILPLAYLGSIEWWREALSPDAVIDVGENYIKQSCRNRCEIATASGRMALTANVVKGASIHKRAVKDMRLDYSRRWQHQHSVALRSAYRSSAYYDYWADLLIPFYEQPHEWLYDFDRGLVDVVRKIANIQGELRFSEEYIVAGEGDVDLRGHDFLGPREDAPNYWQVFMERVPFESNLSVVDYLFNEDRNLTPIIKK